MLLTVLPSSLTSTLDFRSLAGLIVVLWFSTSFAQSPLPPGLSGIYSSSQNLLGAGVGSGNGLGASIGGGISTMNGGLNSLGVTNIKGADPIVQSNTRVPIPIYSQLAPNDFQKFILQVTGQSYQLYGYNFFENISRTLEDPIIYDFKSFGEDEDLIKKDKENYCLK
jgi:hypothetical protein